MRFSREERRERDRTFDRSCVEYEVRRYGNDMTRRCNRATRRLFGRPPGRTLRLVPLLNHAAVAGIESSTLQWHVMTGLAFSIHRALAALARLLGSQAELDPGEPALPELSILEPPPEVPLCRHAPPAGPPPEPVPWEVCAA